MKSITTLLLSLIGFLCLSPQTSVPVEKEPRHKVKFENQYIRVLDVIFPPEYTTLFHTHANDNVAVVISGGKRRVERLGEKPADGISKTGDASFQKATYAHRITNTDEATLHFVDVEILASPNLSKNITVRDKATGYQLILENERVRIYRLKLEAGQSTEFFTRELPNLTVVISPAKVQMESPKQKNRMEDFKPGEFRWWAGSTSHRLKNMGLTNFEAIEIELK